MKKFFRFPKYTRFGMLLLALSALLLLTPPKPAAAHPLGNFSVNRYSRLTLETDHIHLFYVLDMAEIPTFQTWPSIDTDSDGSINETENAHYLSTLLDMLQSNLLLTTNGMPVSLTSTITTLTFPPGQGDLPTLRLEAEFLASIPLTDETWQVAYTDNNFP